MSHGEVEEVFLRTIGKGIASFFDKPRNGLIRYYKRRIATEKDKARKAYRLEMLETVLGKETPVPATVKATATPKPSVKKK